MYNKNPENYEIFFEFIRNTSNNTSEPLLWITRQLNFLEHFLTLVYNSDPDDDDLGAFARISFDKTMHKYMNYFIREAFYIGVKALPTKSVMFGQGERFLENKIHLAPHLEPLKCIVCEFQKLLREIR